MTALGIVLLVVGVLLVLLAVFSLLLANYVVFPKRKTTEMSIQLEDEAGFIRDYEELPKTKYIVKSYDGYELNCVYVPCGDADNKKLVVISHGYTYTKYGSVKYLHCFRKFGYSAVIYDDRGHGDNKRMICSMGVRESRDLIAVLNDAYKRYGEDMYIGLHGESMGSGLQVLSLQYSPKVNFIVNDCGYGELHRVLRAQLKAQFHLPGFLVDTASIMCKLMYGFSLVAIRPIDMLKTSTVPICFMHGESDTFIDKSHSEDMYRAAAGYKELHLYPGAEHARSIASDEKRYVETVGKFLEKVGGLDGNEK